MSDFLKHILKNRFRKILGGGTNKHRCRAPNPSTAKLHGPLPSLEDLLAFEQCYAGVHTPELMERYSGWSNGPIARNKTCLVCLKSTRGHGRSVLICTTCPRTIHVACLNKRAPHSGHQSYCPACVKRRWHLINPLSAVQKEGQSDDDYYMRRVRRYHRWHRYNCQHIQGWQSLKDDGSLESDRQLVINMGVTTRPVNNVEPTTEAEPKNEVAGVADPPPKESQTQQMPTVAGEANEYYDPQASRLGSGTGSVRSDQSRASVRSRHSALSSGSQDDNQNLTPASAHRSPAIASRVSANGEQTRSGPIPAEATGVDATRQLVGSHVSNSSRGSKAASHQTAESVEILRPGSRSNIHNISEDARPITSHRSSRSPMPSELSFPPSIINLEGLASNTGTRSITSAESVSAIQRSGVEPNGSFLSSRSGPRLSTSQGTQISRASTGATSDTSRHVDQQSRTARGSA